jgi:hypothetical protein
MQLQPAYSFQSSVYSPERWTLHLVRHQKGDSQPPLSKEAVSFILKHACCEACGQPMAGIVEHETCGRVRTPRAMVPATFGAEHFAQLRAVMAKNARRRFVATRRERIIVAGGHHTPLQLEALFACQKGRCYYCWRKIVRAGPGRIAQRDHYESVAEGGGENIQNMVFSCLECNAHKNAGHGDSYRRFKLALAAPQTASRLRALHRAVADFHSSC